MDSIAVNSEAVASTFSRLSNPVWYVAYTCPRHEKRVAQQVVDRGMRSFLPIYRSIRRWKDRRKELELPLFPGYCFVQIAIEQRIDLLRVPGVIDLVTFQGKPAPISHTEMEALIRSDRVGGLQPHPYLKVGRKVRVQNGPMAGIEGIFVRRKDRVRIVISVTLIQRAVVLEMDESDVEIVD
jgi:transcription antitermination factor NusG